MAGEDLVYLLKRVAEEKKRALDAGHESARSAHLGLARAYEAKLRDGEDRVTLQATGRGSLV